MSWIINAQEKELKLVRHSDIFLQNFLQHINIDSSRTFRFQLEYDVKFWQLHVSQVSESSRFLCSKFRVDKLIQCQWAHCATIKFWFYSLWKISMSGGKSEKFVSCIQNTNSHNEFAHFRAINQIRWASHDASKLFSFSHLTNFDLNKWTIKTISNMLITTTENVYGTSFEQFQFYALKRATRQKIFLHVSVEEIIWTGRHETRFNNNRKRS